MALFKQLLEKDLKGAPQQVIDYVKSKRQEFTRKYHLSNMCHRRQKERFIEDRAYFDKWYQTKINNIDAFMRKFILDFRNLILSYADNKPVQSKATVETKETTNPSNRFTVGDSRLKFL